MPFSTIPRILKQCNKYKNDLKFQCRLPVSQGTSQFELTLGPQQLSQEIPRKIPGKGFPERLHDLAHTGSPRGSRRNFRKGLPEMSPRKIPLELVNLLILNRTSILYNYLIN